MSTALLTDEIRAAYERDGAVPVRGVVDEHWLERLRAAVERDIAEPGPYYHGYTPQSGEGKFHGNVRLAESDPDVGAFCRESTLPALAGDFFGSDRVNLFYDQLFVKEPGTSNPTRWHNDQPYWPVRGWEVMSFWVALDPVTIDSGSLEFIAGSHKWQRWFQPEAFGETRGFGAYKRNPDFELMPEIDEERERHDIVTWDLEPGDAYAFHALTVHGAGGNKRNDVRRRGLTVRYTGDDAHYDTHVGSNDALLSPAHADGDILDSDRFPVVWRKP